MDLVCSSCQRRLTIDDRYAGMMVKCPLCNGTMQAPVLMSASAFPAPDASSPTPMTSAPPASPMSPSAAPSAPAVPPEVVASSPVAPSPVAPTPVPLPAAEIVAPALPPPGPPPLDVPEVIPEVATLPIARQGEFRKSYRIHLRPDIVEWITPICVVAVFFLSLFPWYYREDYALNLWELAFTTLGHSIYTFYTVVFILAMPVTIVTFCLERRWIPAPDGLRPFWRWRSLVVGGLIGLPFLLFLGDYVSFQFLPFGVQASIAMKLAFRFHLAAVIACALQFWLELRNAANLALPRLTVRW